MNKPGFAAKPLNGRRESAGGRYARE